MSELSVDYMVDKLVDIALNEIWEWGQIEKFDHNVITRIEDGFGSVTIEIEKKS